MARLIVLDACVLIAFADKANLFHLDAVRIMSSPDRFTITALTGAEVMVHPLPSGGWVDLWRDLGVEVASIDAADVPGIADTRRESGLKMPDALVLWLAKKLGAGVATFDERLASKAREYALTVHDSSPSP